MPQSEPCILVATPAYNGQINTEYLHSVLSFQGSGIKFSVQTVANESLITRARNLLISNFWAMKEYTHILFLDADVFLDVNGLKNMLYYNKDVIGAPVALKGKSEHGEVIWNTDAHPGIEPALQTAERVGTAVFMLSRNAVDTLVEDARAKGCLYSPAQRNGSADDNLHYDIFQVGVIDGQYLSEDYWVCRKLKALGFEVYVDTSVYTRHSGTVVFD